MFISLLIIVVGSILIVVIMVVGSILIVVGSIYSQYSHSSIISSLYSTYKESVISLESEIKVINDALFLDER